MYEVPRIPPVSGAGTRPALSVMIPVYEPSEYLLATLSSILIQDPGVEAMQIAVVDDASPHTDTAALLKQANLEQRVTLLRNSKNLGLAGNWNECIAQSRGHLVHLLHQDDLVAPGFYSRLAEGFNANPAVGMAFARYRFIDERAVETQQSDLERKRAGVVPGWLDRITERYRVHCPAVIVRRSVYETLGGFRSDLTYALDWEMWVRIAARYSVWFEPTLLASYRRHPTNASARLESQKATHTDELHAMELFARHLPGELRESLMSRSYARFARSRLRRAKKRIGSNALDAGKYQLECARIAVERLPVGLRKAFYMHRVQRLEKSVKQITRD